MLQAQRDDSAATTAFEKAAEYSNWQFRCRRGAKSIVENLGNCLANLARHLRQLEQIAEVLKIQRVRLELWKNDSVKMLVVADEIAILVTQFPDFVVEFTQAVDFISAAGVSVEDLLKRPAFARLPASLDRS